MTLARTIACSLAVALGSACAAPGEPPREAPSPAAPSKKSVPGISAPLVVHVGAARDVGPDEVELELVIERRTSDPVELELELPAGVELVDGATRETLHDPARRIVRKLRLRLPHGIPTGDVRVRADTRGIGYGVRASTAYRFGRPEPKLAQPARRARSSIANGKRLGKPIPLD